MIINKSCPKLFIEEPEVRLLLKFSNYVLQTQGENSKYISCRYFVSYDPYQIKDYKSYLYSALISNSEDREFIKRQLK